MYKKAAGMLFLVELLLVAGYFGILAADTSKDAGIKTVFEIQLNHITPADEQQCVVEINKTMRSEQRVLTLEVLEKEFVETKEASSISLEDYDNLLRIVEAEAGGEDEVGKILVANVVLNRVESEEFPDSITEVIFQKTNGVTQFSPVADGRFLEVTVSEETITAVNKALSGEDYSGGALYFAARKYADSGNMRWFDENLTFLFEHGGHEFFTD